ncbi:MAG: BlaI/MecI/CopY family transcriptional regulator [Vicinamibacterales bacterium]
MPSAPRPTDAELEVLRVIWDLGPSTVRQIHEVLEAAKPRGYTTILKTIQIMTDKGLLVRDASTRSHVYRARWPEQRTKRQLVQDLVARAFDGSVGELMLQALGTARPSDDQLDALEALIAEKRRRRDGGR